LRAALSLYSLAQLVGFCQLLSLFGYASRRRIGTFTVMILNIDRHILLTVSMDALYGSELGISFSTFTSVVMETSTSGSGWRF
jgi:hypothetical protein